MASISLNRPMPAWQKVLLGLGIGTMMVLGAQAPGLAQVVTSSPVNNDVATGSLTAEGTFDGAATASQVEFTYPLVVQIDPGLLQPNTAYTFTIDITNTTGDGSDIEVYNTTFSAFNPGVASVTFLNNGEIIPDGATGQLSAELVTDDLSGVAQGASLIIPLTIQAERIPAAVP